MTLRILVAALAPSHLLCMVPLAWAARAAGHEVLVSGREEVVRTAAAAGLPTAEVAERPLARAPRSLGPATADVSLPRMARTLSPRDRDRLAGQRWAAGEHPWQVRVARVLDGFLRVARAWRPDVVLCDPIEFAGLVVGSALRVPVVVQRWGGPDSMSAEAIAQARHVLADLASEVGAAEGVAPPALVVDPCPPSLRTDPATAVEPMRFVPYNGARRYPRWARGSGGRPRILVTYGIFGARAAQSGADFVSGGDLAARLDAVLAALGPWRGHEVVVTAPAAVHEQLGSLPDGVRLVERAPLNALLSSRCSLVVHHGGTGTAMTAAVHGVPQLLLPPEHPALVDCARGLEARGVGRVLSGSASSDPGALRAAAGALLEETAARAAARDLAAEIACQPPPASLVDSLVSAARARSVPEP
ncbi:nucleotide disphospho-sugar-binding domain-containing protein [Streptomyces tremellae]|uniref:DUF1205 domain-containing protein n=1 Tax=Streptomyces tremellae TaxID=1124239 RepID=A0ABP7EW20_9ACTN